MSDNLKKNPSNRSSFLPLHPSLTGWTSVLVVKVADKTRDLFNSYLAELGIQTKHYGIIFLIKEQGSLSQVELGQQMNIDRASMVQLIDDLEKLGLVERVANLRDRRRWAVTLTPQGEELLQVAIAFATTAEAELLAPLEEKERQQLHSLLTRLL